MHKVHRGEPIKRIALMVFLMQYYWVGTTLPDAYLFSEFNYSPPLPLELWEYESEFAFRKDEGASIPQISDRVASSLPKRLKYVSQSGLIPDYMKSLGGALISERLRDVFDSLETERRSFYNLDVENSEGKLSRYCIMNISPLSGALDEKRSTLEWCRPPGYSHLAKTKQHLLHGGGGIVFQDCAIAGRHFWRSIDGPIFGNRFASEHLKVKAEEIGIVGMIFDRCREL